MSDPLGAPTVFQLLVRSVRHLEQEHPDLVHLIDLIRREIDQLKARDAVHLTVVREASSLLTSLYDASNTEDPDDLQAWLTARLTAPDGPFTENPYPDNIAHLRAALKAAQYHA